MLFQHSLYFRQCALLQSYFRGMSFFKFAPSVIHQIFFGIFHTGTGKVDF